jgi:hypothetical protein
LPTIRKKKLTYFENKKINKKGEKHRSLKFVTNNRQVNQPINWSEIRK